MRPAFLALLALSLLPRPAHADTLDNFSVVGGGQDFEFSLPASTTASQFDLPPYAHTYGFAATGGALNSVPTNFDINLDFPGPYSLSDTFIISNASGYTELALPALYSLTFDPLAETGTLSFIPGAYPTFVVSPNPFTPYTPYTITITAQTTATTPEPPTILLVATAALGLAWLRRQNRPMTH